MEKKTSMKKMTSLVSALLLFVYFFAPALKAQAEVVQASPLYLALGDSISYGMSAQPGQGYVDQFYNYLKNASQYDGLQKLNASVPGYTSGNLLTLLNTNPAVQSELPNSKVITISIGGNNLLGPVITKIGQLFSVSPSDPDFANKIKLAMAADPINASTKLAGLLTDRTFQTSLAQGAAQFAVDWQQIVTKLKTTAPSAQIYVLTVYNPFNLADPFYAPFELLIAQINTAIKAGAQAYTVVDIHDAFAKHTEQPVVNFNLVKGDLDPHPNQLGHNVIFDSHINHVANLTLKNSSEELKAGDVLDLSYTVAPENATNKDVVWTSSNPEVAVVDANGRITAKANGSATITVSSEENPQKSASCTVTVSTAVSSVALDKAEATLNVGDELQLSAAVSPEDATNTAINWTSSDESVATVDNNGKVKALKAGSSIITVTTADGEKTASCTVTVAIPVTPVSGVVLDKAEGSMNIGDELQLTAAVSPEDATNQAVNWTSSDEAVATVDETGKVTALKAGTANITAVTADGGKTASCTITVKDAQNTLPKTGQVFDFALLSAIGYILAAAGLFIVFPRRRHN